MGRSPTFYADKYGYFPETQKLSDALYHLINKDLNFSKELQTLASENSEIGFYFLLSFRCLELAANNLKALMALAVSYTNTGHQQDACEAFKELD